MDDSKKAEYEQKSKLLRADLKKWESEWALSHNGAKPSRQDIKENPIIGACCRSSERCHGRKYLTIYCSRKIQRI